MRKLSAAEVKALNTDKKDELIADLLSELFDQKSRNEELEKSIHAASSAISDTHEEYSRLETDVDYTKEINERLAKAVEAADKANKLWKTGTIVVGILAAFATSAIFISGMWSDWKKLTAAHENKDPTFQGLNHRNLPTKDQEALAVALAPMIGGTGSADLDGVVRYGDTLRLSFINNGNEFFLATDQAIQGGPNYGFEAVAVSGSRRVWKIEKE